MGNDGGVIAVNRSYLRGAGKAKTTGDYNRRGRGNNPNTTNQSDDAADVMTTCALTGKPLPLHPNQEGMIVCCPFGRLYSKEAAIEALLRKDDRFPVKTRKELYPVRFHFVSKEENTKRVFRPSCPITGTELNGSQPALVIVPSTSTKDAVDTRVNVISQHAIREMGIEALQEEYGPFLEKDLIRLAPTDQELVGIRERVESRRRDMEAERLRKKEKKERKNKKRNAAASHDQSPPKRNKPDSSSRTDVPSGSGNRKEGAAVEAARHSVASAVATNSALSSLFVDPKAATSIPDHERKKNLFVR